MKRFVLSIVLIISAGLVMAQGGFGAQAGDISVSLQLGHAEDFDDLQFVQKNADSYSIFAPSNSTSSTYNNSLVNMIGVEGKYFVASNIAVRLSGMGTISNTPAQQDVPGVPNPDNGIEGLPNMVIPSYSDVPSTSFHKYILNVGGDYYFSTGGTRVFPYAGGQLNMNYGQRKDFTLLDDDLGERVSETYGLGGSVVGGVDYYIGEGFFLGVEVKAFSYMYSVAKMFPQPGMEALDADNHSVNILTNPMVKLGFTF